MKKLLIASTIIAMGFTALANASEPRIIDSALAYQKAGGKAVFMKGAVLKVTDKTYAHAETAKNYRNWMIKGANEGLSHLRIKAPRGKKAPTVQMNHDSLYSVAITRVVDGKISFEIPEDVLVYTSVQVIDQYGHGQHYVVTKGKHTVKIDTSDGTTHAFLIFRSGLEKGMKVAKANQDKLTTWGLVSGDFKVPNYNFDEVDAKTAELRKEVTGKAFYYTFPLNEKAVTDRHQWNLECALGWGGAPPVANVSNLYTNSKMYDGKKSYSTTFMNPQSVYFTSITVYNAQRYLFEDEDIESVNSNSWTVNSDNTVTVSFNCGDHAPNNINTKGQDYTFTVRYYGVTEPVLKSNNKDSVPNPMNPMFMMVEETNPKTAQESTMKNYKASCRCGQLTITYKGLDPKRRSLCHCNSCQLRTGTAFSIQGRFPRENVQIKGKSSKWVFPNPKGPKVKYRSCDSGGVTYHFCPTCGTTVYWDIDSDPKNVGIAIGTLTDPTFPAPVISAFEADGHPWAMNAEDLKIIRLKYDELKEYLEKQKQKRQ